ncbi:Pdk2 [Scenedesmus sp. PABB004]|nr:Pdk2 [Scenedesmus sp. PABB004]
MQGAGSALLLRCWRASSSSWGAAAPWAASGSGAAAAAAAGASAPARRRFGTIPDPDPEEVSLYDTQLAQPNYVQPIAITQLDSLVRHPSLPLLVNSATFLKSQLPARLQNHIHRLSSLPPSSSPALRELLAGTVASKERGLEVAQDWRLVGTDDLEGLRHFESHLGTFKEHLEVEVGRLTSGAQALTETLGWWDDRQQVRHLNRVLDLCHWYLLSARVMLAQHSAALAALEAAGGGSGSGSGDSSGGARPRVIHYHEPGHAATSPTAPYAPPHQALPPAPPGAPRAASLVRRHAVLGDLVAGVADDCRAFCVEKNSAAPDVVLRGDTAATATLVVPYVEYVLTEVLKNAMQAVVNRYGAWEVDDASPVTVDIARLPAAPAAAPDGGAAAAGAAPGVEITVTDMGHGIPSGEISGHMFDYFWSKSKPSSSLYGYSRNHGSPFSGIGVGVPLARVYAHFMGGSIEWETDSWRRHTTVKLTLPANGFTF